MTRSAYQKLIYLKEIIDLEIEFHREHRTPLEVEDYLHERGFSTPREVVLKELTFLKTLLERE